MLWSARRALSVTVASLGVVIGAGVAITWAAGAPGAAGSAPGSPGVAEAAAAPAAGPARSAASRAAAPRLVTTDLTPDGLDRYRYTLRTPPVAEGSPAPGDAAATDAGAGVTAELVVSAPATNQGVNLRSVGWFDEAPSRSTPSRAPRGPSSAGRSPRPGGPPRPVGPGGAQAITVTNNIMWGARNGWNVHLWSGARGDLIGQIVLTHSFGPTVYQTPPLPWRLCARVVGPTLQFKAWSLAIDPTEPEWTDPGYGAGFVLPPEWVYPGRAGWYVGHLVSGDQAGYRSLQAHGLQVSVAERASASTQTSAQEVMRSVAAGLEQVLRAP
jgi:hypothetical protein